jgi:hypothetical protein
MCLPTSKKSRELRMMNTSGEMKIAFKTSQGRENKKKINCRLTLIDSENVKLRDNLFCASDIVGSRFCFDVKEGKINLSFFLR